MNNSYLGLIRQSQRGFQMDFEVSLASTMSTRRRQATRPPAMASIMSRSPKALGCKAIRVKSPNEFKEAFAKAQALMKEFSVPVVIEFILERVTNIAMGTEVNNVNEFEEILCLDPNLSINESQDMGAIENAGRETSQVASPSTGLACAPPTKPGADEGRAILGAPARSAGVKQYADQLCRNFPPT